MNARLEALNPCASPTESDELLGSWSLDFTDAADVLALGLLPAWGGMPHCTAVRNFDEPTALWLSS